MTGIKHKRIQVALNVLNYIQSIPHFQIAGLLNNQSCLVAVFKGSQRLLDIILTNKLCPCKGKKN